MLANLPAYFESWSQEIASRADRVRLLIGSKHWLSDGVHKEFLIREFLARHLPSGLNTGRGFIRKLDIDLVSPEVDIIVADPRRHVPIFREGDLQIVPPSSVLATIEVKSTYRKQVLRDAMSNVYKVRSVTVRHGSGSDVWSSIMIGTAEQHLTLHRVVDDLYSILSDSQNWSEMHSIRPCISLRDCMPSLVCILDFCLILLESDHANESVRIRAFEAQRASAALAFSQLFAFLRSKLTDSTSPGELDSLLEQIDGLPTIIKSLEQPKQ